MEILYLLIPMGVVLAMLIIGTLAWAMNRGQFDDLEHQGELIFDPEQIRARAEAQRTQPRMQAESPPTVDYSLFTPDADIDSVATPPHLDMGQHDQKHLRA